MAETYEKIGHNIDLKGFVIHKVTKEAGKRGASLKLADKAILPTDKEKRFIANVSKVYYKKSGPTYGIFDNSDANEFQKNLISYNSSDQDFITFTHNAMKSYEKTIANVVAASGGFIVFAHYCNSDKKADYLLVLAINNKDGYFFNESNLTLEDIQNIDLNKIDLACEINMSKWSTFISETDSDIKTYLSLVRGNKDISYYFLEFIGSANKTTSTESSKRLVNALKKFAENQGYDTEKQMEMRNTVYGYCYGCIKEKKEISLSAISALVDHENPTLFQEFAAGEEYGVDESISGNPSVLKGIGVVKYKEKGKLTLEFGNDLLNTRVFYDKNKKTVTIKDISLSDQIIN